MPNNIIYQLEHVETIETKFAYLKGARFMNRRFRSYIVVIMALAMVCFGSLIGQANGVVKAEQVERGVLSVHGEGVVYAKPTIARIHLGVETERPNAKEAQQENAKIMSAIVQSLMDMGFAEDDIKTANYSIYPVRSTVASSGEYRVVGYRVSNTLIVTVRDLDRVGEVIDVSTQAGANNVSSIQFDIEDSSDLYYKALELAVSDASTKARVIARATGQELDRPMKIYESSSSRPVTFDGYDTRFAMASAEYATPIIPGDVAIRASVSIEYALK